MLSGNGRHRRPRQAPAFVVTAGVTGSALALPLLAGTSAQAADSATWDRIADCESGGAWSANAGNGYYGGLQLTQQDWEAYGGRDYAPRPDLASRAQQIAVAERILDGRGTEVWRICAAVAELTGEGSDPSVDPGLPSEEAEPTQSAEPSDAPAPTDSPEPTDSTEPTAPEPSASPEPSGSSDSAEPSGSPTPTGTPTPSDSAEPSGSAEPSDGTDPSPSPEPTESADPTEPIEVPSEAVTPDESTEPGEFSEPTGMPTPTPSDSSAPADPTAQPTPSTGTSEQPTGDPDANSPENGESSTPAPAPSETPAPDATGRHRGDPAPDDNPLERPDSGAGRHSRPGDSPADAAGSYTVRPGDNLWAIADAHEVEGGWPALYALNRAAVGVDPDLILPGQSLSLGAESGARQG